MNKTYFIIIFAFAAVFSTTFAHVSAPAAYSDDISEFSNATVIASSLTSIEKRPGGLEDHLEQHNKNYPDSAVKYLDLTETFSGQSSDVKLEKLKERYGDATLLYHIFVSNDDNISDVFSSGQINSIVSSANDKYVLASGTIRDMEQYMSSDNDIEKIILPHVKNLFASEDSIGDPYALHNYRYHKTNESLMANTIDTLPRQNESLVPSIKISQSAHYIFDNAEKSSTPYMTKQDEHGRSYLSVHADLDFADDLPNWLNVTSVHTYEGSRTTVFSHTGMAVCF